MSAFIPLSVPSLRGNEWLYVKECIDQEWVSSVGSFVERFEREIAAYTGAKHAVACINGTAALHIALLLAGVRAGDEVLVPTATFIAPVNVIRYVGAQPVFMDCDEYYNLDIEKTLEFLKEQTETRDNGCYNRTTGRRISAIIPVHVFGNAVNLGPLLPQCQNRQIKIVEDATESLGTRYMTPPELKGQHAGTVGDIGCLSFNGNKIITTGGGGMILTDNEAYAEKARYLTTQAKDDSVRYLHHEVGYNYRLGNIQAAIGVAQLERLPEYLEIKRRNYLKYQTALADVQGLHLGAVPPYASNNLWMYALQINSSIYGMGREELMAKLNQEKIQTRPLWNLNHLQKPYLNCQSYRLTNAVRLLDITLNLPCSISLEEEQLQAVVACLKRLQQ